MFKLGGFTFDQLFELEFGVCIRFEDQPLLNVQLEDHVTPL